jgi:hypothetical protein
MSESTKMAHIIGAIADALELSRTAANADVLTYFLEMALDAASGNLREVIKLEMSGAAGQDPTDDALETVPQ